MTAPTADRVQMPRRYLWLFRLGCPAAGVGLAFAVRPVLRWLLGTLDSAPAPLRLAGEIPLPWLVPILGVIGAGFGLWLSREAERDSLTLTVDGDGMVATQRDTERYLPRSHVGAVFTDPKDLVVLGSDGRQLFRGSATDLPAEQLVAALRGHGYPWRGEHDPYEDHYQRWIDGHPDVDGGTNALLQARRRALHDKDRGRADDVHAQLQERGVVVRDRDNAQQYRLVDAAPS